MRRLGLLLCGAVLAGCQGATTMVITADGRWASDDGVFVATFDKGAFTSRLTTTGETVVADGRYVAGANGLSLTWTSLATNEVRTADCNLVKANQLSCAPSVGTTFTMTRVG